MLDAFTNIFRIPDLRKRVIFTFAILAILQIGQFITIPGVNPLAIKQNVGSGQGLFSLVDLFAGGAFGNVSIFALGIMPYISASIILQLLTVTSPYLEELSKKGEEGRKKINQYTRYLTVLITLFQSFMLSFSIENPQGMWGDVVYYPGWGFRMMCMLSMTTGTVIIMWLGEQITEFGIGNGISLVIFANIVAQVPSAVSYAAMLLYQGDPYFTPITALIVFFVLVGVIAAVVIIQYGQRRVPIKRGRQVRGGRMYGAQSNSYLPLRINTAGVIPVIFAAAILMLPATFVQFLMPFQQSEGFMGYVFFAIDWISNQLQPGQLIYTILYVGLIIFFCYFYTAITFNPKDVAENLQKYGSTIPGYSHGKRTEEYLNRILNRITLAGAIFLAMVAIVPDIMTFMLDIPRQIAFLLGGTSIIIIVGVALDTVNQVENHLRVRNYEGFRRRGRIRGRSGM